MQFIILRSGLYRVNPKLNHRKSVEIVYSDSMSRSLLNPRHFFDDISRVMSVKILVMAITNKLSVNDHKLPRC